MRNYMRKRQVSMSLEPRCRLTTLDQQVKPLFLSTRTFQLIPDSTNV